MKEAASNITTSKWILFVDRCRGEDPEHKVLGREVSVWTHEDNIKKKTQVENKQTEVSSRSLHICGHQF